MPYKNTLEKVAIVNSTYKRQNLKDRLYKLGLKAKICELCGQGELWRGSRISLILDHINGINNDHRLENLRIVCPNCNATFPTHCGGNMKKKDKPISLCACGNKKQFQSRVCRKCSDNNRKSLTQCPGKQVILEEMKTSSCYKIGLKYGVSRTTIKRWSRK